MDGRQENRLWELYVRFLSKLFIETNPLSKLFLDKMYR